MTFEALKRIVDFDQLADRVAQLWIDFQTNQRGNPPRESKVDPLLLERMSHDKQTLYVIFNVPKFRLEFVGSNAEQIIGYSSQEFIERQFGLIFRLMSEEHIFFFVRALTWTKHAVEILPLEKLTESFSYCVSGLAFKHKKGHTVKTFIRVFPIETCEKGQILTAIIEISDKTVALKGDDYFMQITAGKKEPQRIAFFSNQKTTDRRTELLSERELEILQLVAEGYSTKSIGERLFISPLTVEKHRKNMLARVGARDTSALVEICRRCGIL